MTPYYQDAAVTIYHGDCREIFPSLAGDVVIADPPYGQTSLQWDKWPEGWLCAMPTKSLWCFGTLRMFMERTADFHAWKLSQDIIWEKHNGSGFHADRFRRIHEQVAHFYRGAWADVYKSPVMTADATARTVRAKGRPTHMGHIERTPFVSHDGGPRLQRSVIKVRSTHGYADHPTQKPEGIVRPLVEYSCPPGGVVLVPFVGSGTDLLVAKQLGRRAIGVEIDEANCEIAARACGQGVLRLETA